MLTCDAEGRTKRRLVEEQLYNQAYLHQADINQRREEANLLAAEQTLDPPGDDDEMPYLQASDAPEIPLDQAPFLDIIRRLDLLTEELVVIGRMQNQTQRTEACRVLDGIRDRLLGDGTLKHQQIRETQPEEEVGLRSNFGY